MAADIQIVPPGHDLLSAAQNFEAALGWYKADHARKVKELLDRQSQLHTEHEATKIQLSKARAGLADSEARIASLKEDKDSQQIGLNNQANEIVQLESRQLEFRTAISELAGHDSSIHMTTNVEQDIEALVESIKIKRQGQQRRYKVLRKKYQRSNRIREGNLRDVNSQNDLIASLKAEKEQLEVKLQFSQELAQAEVDKSAARSGRRKKILSSKSNALRNSHTQLQSENTDLKQQISKLQQAKDEHQRRADQLQMKDYEYQQRQEKLQTAYEERQEHLNQLQRDMDKLKHRHETQQAQLGQQNEQIDVLKAEICQLQKHMKDEAESWRGKADSQRSDHEKVLHDAAMVLRRVRSTLNLRPSDSASISEERDNEDGISLQTELTLLEARVTTSTQQCLKSFTNDLCGHDFQYNLFTTTCCGIPVCRECCNAGLSPDGDL